MTITKSINSVNAKGLYLCAGILIEKSASSPATAVFKSKTNTNEKLIAYLVYPQIIQISERSL